jgi:hypothetical protein
MHRAFRGLSLTSRDDVLSWHKSCESREGARDRAALSSGLLRLAALILPVPAVRSSGIRAKRGWNSSDKRKHAFRATRCIYVQHAQNTFWLGDVCPGSALENSLKADAVMSISKEWLRGEQMLLPETSVKLDDQYVNNILSQ